MFIRIPYNVSAPNSCLAALDPDGRLLFSLDVRYCPENPEAFFTYPLPEGELRFTLDGKDLSPELTEAPETGRPDGPYPHHKLTFTPSLGWLNDPNGLFWLNGTWHMFFQHNPVGAIWGNMSWGHAVSTDLVHWTEKPIALYPDELGTMFSGSAIVDFENASGLGKDGSPAILLFYTAAGGANVLSAGKAFCQCMAFSTDGGETFTKYPGNPVIGTICNSTRDPKVVRDGKGGYMLALFKDDPDRSYMIFRSKNLIDWELSQTLRIPPDTECPDLYPIDVDGKEKWVYSGASDYYVIGDFDASGQFIFDHEEIHRLDHSDLGGYAAQTWSDAPAGRRVKTYWNRWNGIPEKGPRRCSMGAPCDISAGTVNGKALLMAEICPEIVSAFSTRRVIDASGETVLSNEQTLMFSFDNNNAPFSLDVRGAKLSWDGKELRLCNDTFTPQVLPGKVTVFADGINLQLHCSEGTFMWLAPHQPTADQTLAVFEEKTQVSVFEL